MAAATINTTYLTSEITSAFTSAFGLSREFLRRALVSINVGQALMESARDFTVEQLHFLHHAAKTLLTQFISVCRHIATDAIEEYPILRSAEEYLVPQPSYENLTFHAERGACVWTYSSTGLPADFSPHTSTLFLLLATNVCTAILCLSIGAAIFAPLRVVWQGINALASLVDKPKATWETVLEELTPPLAMLAAAGIHGIIFCATAMLFCVGNLIIYATDLDIGFLKRPAPQVEEPKVFYRTLADPRVAQLEDDNRKLQRELDEKSEIWDSNRVQDAKRISDLLGENTVLEDANMTQKLVIKGHMMMQAKIDLTRPMYDQYVEEKKRCHDAQQAFNRVTEEKIALQSDFWKQLDEHTQEIGALKKAQRSYQQRNIALTQSNQWHQDRANRGDEVSRAQIEFQKKRIKELEGLEAPKKKTIESLEAQLKQRDELINTQKEATQALESRIKEQQARHSSEQKSQKTQLMEGFEREMSKLVKLSKDSSEACKSAEEGSKVAEDACKVADEAREAAEQARKAAEEKSLASLKALNDSEEALKAAEEARKTAEEARKTAEEARKTAEEARKTAEEARKTAEEDAALQKFRLANRPYSYNKGTQTSSSPPGSPSMEHAGSSSKVSPSSSTGTPPPPSSTGTPPLPPSTGAPLPPPPGKTPLPPPGQRPILKAKSVARKPMLNLPGNSGSYKSSSFPQMNNFSFEFSGGATPKVAETSPTAPSSEPLPPLPSTPEPETPPAPSTPEPANVSPLFSSPESKSSPAASNPEPVPEPVPEPAPTEDSPAKPASPSGEQSEAPEPTAA